MVMITLSDRLIHHGRTFTTCRKASLTARVDVDPLRVTCPACRTRIRRQIAGALAKRFGV